MASFLNQDHLGQVLFYLYLRKEVNTEWLLIYRKLNEKTKKEVYALPRIDDVLDGLGGKIWYSRFSLWLFSNSKDEECKGKTAFITYDGQYHYNYMSFGLVNAPSTFQRCTDKVLAGLKWNCV